MGHDYLWKNFGYIPRHAWHPDTFGHSSGTPEVFARMGFESISFARIDHYDKEKRRKDKQMEFIWRPNFEGLLGSYQTNLSI